MQQQQRRVAGGGGGGGYTVEPPGARAGAGGVWRQAVWRWAWTPRGEVRGGGRRDLALLAHNPHNVNILREMLRLESLQRRLRPNPMPLSPVPQLDWHDQLVPGYEHAWRIPDMQIPAGTASPAPARHPAWQPAARGWGLAALLLTLILLLVRLSDKCLDTRLFKGRRRRPIEWSTANVLATTNVHNENIDDMDGIDPYCTEHVTSEGVVLDLPPPYSACSPHPQPAPSKPPLDEPPPPYSACYVAFANPKHGQPSIRFFGIPSSDARESSERFVDTGQGGDVTRPDGRDDVTVSSAAAGTSRDDVTVVTEMTSPGRDADAVSVHTRGREGPHPNNVVLVKS